MFNEKFLFYNRDTRAYSPSLQNITIECALNEIYINNKTIQLRQRAHRVLFIIVERAFAKLVV